jgi:ATP-dependent DNA ligase
MACLEGPDGQTASGFSSCERDLEGIVAKGRHSRYSSEEGIIPPE